MGHLETVARNDVTVQTVWPVTASQDCVPAYVNLDGREPAVTKVSLSQTVLELRAAPWLLEEANNEQVTEILIKVNYGQKNSVFRFISHKYNALVGTMY